MVVRARDNEIRDRRVCSREVRGMDILKDGGSAGVISLCARGEAKSGNEER